MINQQSTPCGHQYSSRSTLSGANETHLLHEYIQCLEKQNHTKNLERHTLYAELEKLQKSVHTLELQLSQAKSLVSSKDTTSLVDKIRDLEEEINILKYEQQHLFEENLSLINNLEQSSHKLLQTQRQNKELKSHKEELEKFRIALEKITQNLEQIEIQRFALAQNNLVLVEENTYLKQMLSGKIPFDKNQEEWTKHQEDDTQMYSHANQVNSPRFSQQSLPQVTSVSNYLMSNSFQKISEYEEEYEESNGNSISRNQNSSKYQSCSKESDQNEGSCEKSVKQWKEDNIQIVDKRQNQQNRSIRSRKNCEQRSIEKDEPQNQSSYLIFDERSAQSFSLSFEVHQPHQRPSNLRNQSFSDGLTYQCSSSEGRIQENLQEENQNEEQKSSMQEKYEEDSSNDVIQDISEDSTLKLLNRTIEDKNKKFIKSDEDTQDLMKELMAMRQKLSQSQSHCKELQNKIKQMEKAEAENISHMESKIQELLTNYESIVKYTQQLEEDNIELFKHNQILEQNNMETKAEIQAERQQIQEAFREIVSEKEHLEKTVENLAQEKNILETENNELNIKMEQLEKYCLEAQEYLNEVSQGKMESQNFFNQNSEHYVEFSPSMSNFDLIKQNNQLIERVNELEMERSSFGNKNQSRFSNGSRLSYTQENDKENFKNSLNSQRQSPSSNVKFFRTISQEQRNDKNNSNVSNPKNTSLSFRSQIQKEKQRRESEMGVKLGQKSCHKVSSKRESLDPRQSLKDELQSRIKWIKHENMMLMNELEYC